ncbi:NTP transferase domain-containing protein [Granulosicoccus antarcticus]|uniref:Molybdenum cofactor cytidylyltransferase n=1 Tax=Granulosicoccus antarcticus IMCC3135 TaxID=1192854 RepID=A0A2Z2NX54_9GAMM|nr:molybdopterin-binding/glycosyltransferase family 2 protein [Granulosicoccus antarcticus]ASJ74338.1 Molybdenum cofactor cytidylyltransferase [Granulosicoccus antarcticus IMCC3135]
MIFGEVCVRESVGSYLAHSLKTPEGKLRKGRKITQDHIRQLLAGDHERVTVAQLETDDVHEDEAALIVARALAGEGVRLGQASTGRVNIHALVDGVCDFDRNLVDQANAVDEGITVATVMPSSSVGKGRLIATVKIIPFAVNKRSVEQVVAVFTSQLQVHASLTRKAFFIQTRLPTLKLSVLDKTSRVTQQRLLAHHADLLDEVRVPHRQQELVSAIEQGLAAGADWILVAGASAIADRKDVIPAAITHLGGVVHHFGMPMDPGNLLLVGSIGSTHIIGMPGCARSSRPNGLDKVLERLASGLTVDSGWISTLGVGGLLHEIMDRPEPRVAQSGRLSVAALVLAAGSSTRFGEQNKLLALRHSRPVLAHVLEEVEHSTAGSAVLVTGHEADQVGQLCNTSWRSQEMPISVVHNPLYATGMASSLVRGVAELSARGTDAALVCLGDMPNASRQVMEALIQAFRQAPDKALYIPTFNGRRGNPVIIAASLFDSVLMLEGDVGARVLARQFPDSVVEVACAEPGVLLDIDTPDDLVALV